MSIILVKSICTYNFIIFQRRQVFWLVSKIKRSMNVVGLSSEMTAVARDSAMEKFQNNVAQVLVCTNLCSRALNLDVNLVVNYDIPRKEQNQFDQKVYTYRVSRTGRFGKSGVAITLNSSCVSNVKELLLKEFNVKINVI